MRISEKIVSGYPKPRKIIFAYFYSVAVDQYLAEMNTISWFQVVLYCFLYTLYWTVSEANEVNLTTLESYKIKKHKRVIFKFHANTTVFEKTFI